ncbi:MAG: hypothetical protein SNJ56_06100 [Termitinemataceae bacterium]
MRTTKLSPLFMSLIFAASCVFQLPAQQTGHSSSAATGATKGQTIPAPYTKEEFPSWALDLRRAEIVAFGSLPFTLFFTTFAVDSYRFAVNDWDLRYAPWPLKPAGAIEMDEKERIASFSVAIGLSIVISLVDYFIVQHKRRHTTSQTVQMTKPDIVTLPWPESEGDSGGE